MWLSYLSGVYLLLLNVCVEGSLMFPMINSFMVFILKLHMFFTSYKESEFEAVFATLTSKGWTHESMSLHKHSLSSYPMIMVDSELAFSPPIHMSMTKIVLFLRMCFAFVIYF